MLGPQAVNCTRDYELDLAGPGGSSLAGLFTGSETIRAVLRQGSSQPALATIAGTWLNPTAAVPTALVTVSKATLAAAGITPGFWSLQVVVNPGTDDVELLDDILRITPAAGSESTPSCLCSLQDMLDLAGWVEDLESLRSGALNFLKQRGRATSWLKDVIVGKWKVSSYAPQIGQPGYGAWAMFGGSADPPPSVWLRQQLDAGYLVVTDQVKEIVAMRAIAYACATQLGKKDGPDYPRLARSFRLRSDALVKVLRAEIDTNGDGYAEIVVNCGATNVR